MPLESTTGRALYIAGQKELAGKSAICFDKKHNKKVAAQWAALPAEEQEVFDKQATEAKAAHAAQMDKYEEDMEKFQKNK